MLEIVALIFLTRHIAKIAERKGLKPGTWKVYTILAWFAGEITGALVGVFIFQLVDLIPILLAAIMGALTGYLILKSSLSKSLMPELKVTLIK